MRAWSRSVTCDNCALNTALFVERYFYDKSSLSAAANHMSIGEKWENPSVVAGAEAGEEERSSD